MTRVLIVDDNPANLYLLRMLLQGHGYIADEASNGAEALSKARQTPPDLTISDLLMPVMDGYTFLRQWKTDDRLKVIPFVVYTATYTDSKDERLALDLGADAFIIKPTEPEPFLDRIQEVLVKKERGELKIANEPQVEENVMFKKYNAVLVRKLEEKALQLEQTNRALHLRSNLYAMLSRTNRAVSHCQSRDDLFREVCAIAVETGQFRFAWIGVPDGDRLKMVASSGEDGGYMAETITLAEINPHSQVPVECGILSGSWFVVNDFLASPLTTPWHENARRVGFAASAAFPFTEQGQVVAILTLYADTCGYFTDDMMSTLSEITPSISFALDRFVQERNRQRDEAELHLRDRAIRAVSQGIVITDPRLPDNPIIYTSPSFERMTGYSIEESIGQNCRFLQGKETDPALVAKMRNALQEERDCTVELLNYRKDGTPFWNNLTISPVVDQHGQLTHFVGVQTDVTERRKLEAQFLRAQRLDSLGTLASGIAHDLNNILAPILISIQLLRQKLPDEKSRRILETLETTTLRGAELIKQVLSFGRGIEGNRLIVQIKHLILEIEKIIKATFPKSIDIQIDISNDLNTVSADITQLHQVLMNLCVNARDAMPNGGRLTITARNFLIDETYTGTEIAAKPGNYIIISVSDTGTGISPEVIDKIFDPFFTTKEFGKGTGLGLSTVIGIVQSHDGFTNVYSEVGRGSEFRIYLPAAETTSTESIKEEREELLRGHGELILVVDDETPIREITKFSLEANGYRVLTAGNGVEAIVLFIQNQNLIKVVLTDLMMPQMDGPDLIPELQRLNPQVKIIAMSGLTPRDKLTEAAVLGVKKFLSKPYTAEMLFTVLHEVLIEN